MMLPIANIACVFSGAETIETEPSGEQACENREKLLKAMAGKGDSGASNYRVRTLLGLGLCEVKKENWVMAKKRLESTISEMNVPSEDMMMKNPDLAPVALTKQASEFMKKFELTQAGTQFRRCREVLDRNLKTVLKKVHQQMSRSPSRRFFIMFLYVCLSYDIYIYIYLYDYNVFFLESVQGPRFIYR